MEGDDISRGERCAREESRGTGWVEGGDGDLEGGTGVRERDVAEDNGRLRRGHTASRALLSAMEGRGVC